MNRRQFLASSGLALTALAARSLADSPARGGALDRIGMGTVIFRTRFLQTRPKDFQGDDRLLTLLEVPQYYRDRFGLRNVEFWSYHFESLEPEYLAALKAKLQAAGSRLINIQVDTSYNLASADAAERRESLAEVKRWLDAAAALGSAAVRVNPGNGSVDTAIASMREVNDHARARRLPLLIENHFGIEMDPDVHLRIREEAGPENIYTLPDFGNYPDEARYESLARILPHAYLVSAKGVAFNDDGEHVSYDFDRCVRLAEQAGFRGIYSVEQWSREYPQVDYEKIADWLIARVQANLAG